MDLLLKKIEKIIVIATFAFLSFSNVLAFDINNSSDIYQYNALKNNVSFRDVGDSINSFGGIQTTDILLPVDVLKELQDITKKQNISLEEINMATDVLKNRSVIKTFFVGNNLGTLKFQLVQIEDQIYLLEALAPKTNDNKIQTQINDQAKSLKEEKTKVENFILEKDNKFSLFGWLVTSF